MKQTAGRTAVITGGASGIGYAMAKRFAEAGMNIVIADIEQERLDDAVSMLKPLAKTIGVRTDVSSRESVHELAQRTMEEFGAVQVVCNNAGVESGGPFADVPMPIWQWVMNVNYYGVLNGCLEFLPLLRQQEEGHIVNTVSVGAFSAGVLTFAPYVASKFAVLGLTESLSTELRANGEPIGVSVLVPGPVKTRMMASERNRPSDVPLAVDDPLRNRVMEALARNMDTDGMDPNNVADLVLRSIEEDRFFILPHPDKALDGVRKRLHWMETNEAPQARTAGT